MSPGVKGIDDVAEEDAEAATATAAAEEACCKGPADDEESPNPGVWGICANPGV